MNIKPYQWQTRHCLPNFDPAAALASMFGFCFPHDPPPSLSHEIAATPLYCSKGGFSPETAGEGAAKGTKGQSSPLWHVRERKRNKKKSWSKSFRHSILYGVSFAKAAGEFE